MIAPARSVLSIGLRSLAVSPRTATRLGVVLLLAMIGVATLTAIGAYQLSFSAPEWWRTVRPSDPETIRLAEETEQAISSAIHRRRELGEPWTVAITAQQANAWINVMLPRWLENREVERPEWTAELQTHFEDGRIAAGAKVGDERGRPRYVTLQAEPMVDQAGSLWLRPAGASVGRLGVPLRWTFEELERRAGRDQADLVGALRGRRPVIESASLELGDGRVVSVVDLRIRDGRLLVTAVTTR